MALPGSRWLDELENDISALLLGDSRDQLGIADRLRELSLAALPAMAAYWRSTGYRIGVPYEAFRGESLYHFEEEPARTFHTSGTSGHGRGAAHYSARGMRLMNLSIRTGAAWLFAGLDRPIVLRLVPLPADAPHMVMAHGMNLMASTYGDPEQSVGLVGPGGVDLDLLRARLDAACADDRPVVLLGGTTAVVNVLDALAEAGRAWQLPPGSRLVDAGGSKGTLRAVTQAGMRAAAADRLGIETARCTNLYGMTELASQLYDVVDEPVAPGGERPKGSRTGVEAVVLDPETLQVTTSGAGLLQVHDLAVIDRPHVVLTGDFALATRDGAAIVGRVARSIARGCSLALDAMTAVTTGRAA